MLLNWDTTKYSIISCYIEVTIFVPLPNEKYAYFEPKTFTLFFIFYGEISSL